MVSLLSLTLFDFSTRMTDDDDDDDDDNDDGDDDDDDADGPVFFEKPRILYSE